MKKYVIEENLYNVEGVVVEATRNEETERLQDAITFMEGKKSYYLKSGFLVEDDMEESGFFVICENRTFSHVRVKVVIEEYL